MSSSNSLTGKWGEAEAAAYLRRKGYILLAWSYRCRQGEIDLIARRKDELVFCEVKTRKDADFARPMEFVDRKKQERLRTTAQLWLAQYDRPYTQCRFDVIEVYAPEGVRTRHPKIRHIENAFV